MGLRDKAKTAKIVEEQNIYLAQPQKGLELCANIMSIGKTDYEDSLEKIDEILTSFMGKHQVNPILKSKQN